MVSPGDPVPVSLYRSRSTRPNIQGTTTPRNKCVLFPLLEAHTPCPDHTGNRHPTQKALGVSDEAACGAPAYRVYIPGTNRGTQADHQRPLPDLGHALTRNVSHRDRRVAARPSLASRINYQPGPRELAVLNRATSHSGNHTSGLGVNLTPFSRATSWARRTISLLSAGAFERCCSS
jgi:hypothetical protein